MLENAATAPTDRSMPAAMITKVSPKASIAIVDAWIPTLSRLVAVKNEGAIKLRTIPRSSSPTRAPLRPTKRYTALTALLPPVRAISVWEEDILIFLFCIIIIK